METVSINTTQNVRISYNLATLGDRILGYIIDSLIIFGITVALVIILSVIGAMQSAPYLLAFAVLPAFFYHLIMEITQNGQSPGKKVMKIKVVKLDGGQASIGNYLLRWLLRPIDTFLYGAVAILCISIGGKGQRLGDLAAGTTVIKLNKSGFLKEHTLEHITEQYQPVFMAATQLTPEYIAVIQKATRAKLEMLDEKPVIRLAEKTKAKLNIHTDLPDLKFLHTIVKDYHYLKTHEQETIG